mgnify:CR=1 FL=1
MKKNTAGQKITVFLFNTTTAEPITGDAANITTTVSKDDAAPAALADINPTELGGGHYSFDTTQEETNAHKIVVLTTSTTANAQAQPLTITTTEPAEPITAGRKKQAKHLPTLRALRSRKVSRTFCQKTKTRAKPKGTISPSPLLSLKGTAKKRQFIYFKHSRPKLPNQSTTPREPASHGEKKAGDFANAARVIKELSKFS